MPYSVWKMKYLRRLKFRTNFICIQDLCRFTSSPIADLHPNQSDIGIIKITVLNGKETVYY